MEVRSPLPLGGRKSSHLIAAMYNERRVHSSIRISRGRANEQNNEAGRQSAGAPDQLRTFGLS